MYECFISAPSLKRIQPDLKARLVRHGFKQNEIKRLFRPVIESNYSLDMIQAANIEMFNIFKSKCDAKISGDKNPFFISFIDQLVAMFPDAHYIYTVRDPRAVWNSAERFLNEKQGDKWLNNMLAWDKRIEPYMKRDNFIMVRFEDLLSMPNIVCNMLYKFLGVDYKIEYLHYDRDKDPYPERLGIIKNTVDALDTSICDKWKGMMTDKQIQAVNEKSAQFMEKYKYAK